MTLVVPASLISQMVADAQQHQPQEACGLLIGTGQAVQRVLPLPNSDPQPHQGFVLDPQALVAALYQIDADEQAVLGVYHSHPRSASFPSARDIEGAAQWPDAVQVIISLQGRPRLQAWRITPGQVERIDIAMTGEAEIDVSLSQAARLAILSGAFLAVLLLIGLSVSLLPAAPVITPVP